MLNVVAALTLPEASAAVMESMLVLEAVKSTEADQSPLPVVVAVEVEAPPVMEMVELASAVPYTLIGFVLVE